MVRLAIEPFRGPRLAVLVSLVVFAALAATFASFHLRQDRFYDERFALQNVHALLQTGRFEPANGYYATLSYLPQTLALAALEATAPPGRSWIYLELPPPPADADAETAGSAFTPLAYGVCRAIQVAWGLVSLAVLYALGRRRFGPWTAALAVALLASSPWFLLASAKFKPDASLLATTLLALWLSCRAAERELSWARYGGAGAAIAAAMSCKLTGGVSAIPLTLVSLAQARRDPRRLLGLGLAGVTSLVLFLLANPHLRLYLRFMERLTAEYEDKAKLYGGTHLGVVRRSLALVVDETGFGPIFGSLALVGFVAFALRALRSAPSSSASSSSPPSHSSAAVLASNGARPAVGTLVLWLFPPLYLAAVAASTPHFKGNNVLSILPPLALFGAWAAVAGLGVVRRLLRARRPSRLVRWAALGLVAAYLSHGIGTYVYQGTVPTTHDLAERWLFSELAESDGRALIVPSTPPKEGRYPWYGTRLGPPRPLARFPLTPLDDVAAPVAGAVAAPVDVLTSTSWDTLRQPWLADGIIAEPERLRPARLDLPDPVRAATIGTQIEPGFWHARGPRLAVRAWPWKRQGDLERPRVAEQDGQLRLAWPATGPPAWCSLEVWIPQRMVDSFVPRFDLGDESLPLVWLRSVGRGHLFTSPRFRCSPRAGALLGALPVPRPGGEGVAFALYRWQPGWQPDEAGSSGGLELPPGSAPGPAPGPVPGSAPGSAPGPVPRLDPESADPSSEGRRPSP